MLRISKHKKTAVASGLQLSAGVGFDYAYCYSYPNYIAGSGVNNFTGTKTTSQFTASGYNSVPIRSSKTGKQQIDIKRSSTNYSVIEVENLNNMANNPGLLDMRTNYADQWLSVLIDYTTGNYVIKIKNGAVITSGNRSDFSKIELMVYTYSGTININYGQTSGMTTPETGYTWMSK